MKSFDYAKRNEKDVLIIEKQYSGTMLQSFAIQLRKLHSIFRFEEKGSKLGHLTDFSVDCM